MLSFLFKRIRNPSKIGAPSFSNTWKERLTSGLSKEFLDTLQQSIVSEKDFSIAELIAQATTAGWNATDLEKLAAYSDYFSGHPESAHRRVISMGLARTDYMLFAIACEQCYKYNRFTEGYALLKQFCAELVEELPTLRFNDLAGYMAYCGGGTLDEACSYYDAALATGEITSQLAVNAYPVYFEAGRHRIADFLKTQLSERCSDDPQALYALAWGELARDYYPEGFRLAEARYNMPDMLNAFGAKLNEHPRWQGEPLQDRHLLVRGEQGYGDLLMMARYFPLLQEKGSTVIIECLEAAIPLLEECFPNCRFIPGGLGQAPKVAFDVWIGLMSLPHVFSSTAETIPFTEGYLKAPKTHTDYWHDRCLELSRAGNFKIGIAWSGNPGHKYDQRRSISFDKLATYLNDRKDIDFFSLQMQVPESRPANLHDMSGEILTFADTAALIDEMDLVITVDTSIVHLAGAMGKKTWLLLPYRYEWRWSLSGERNNWYDSVRVLRQASNGDWQGLLVDVFQSYLPNFLQGEVP